MSGRAGLGGDGGASGTRRMNGWDAMGGTGVISRSKRRRGARKRGVGEGGREAKATGALLGFNS